MNAPNDVSSPCLNGVQTCISGQWVGPKLYANCSNTTKSCDGLPQGTVMSGYLEPAGNCAPAIRTCLDGIWNGPEVFSSCVPTP